MKACPQEQLSDAYNCKERLRFLIKAFHKFQVPITIALHTSQPATFASLTVNCKSLS
jgi:hypothetical protein